MKFLPTTVMRWKTSHGKNKVLLPNGMAKSKRRLTSTPKKAKTPNITTAKKKKKFETFQTISASKGLKSWKS